MQKYVGIDVEEALRRLMGNEGLLLTVVKGLTQEFVEGRPQMVDDLENHRFDVLASKVHRLKGVAANISANTIYQVLAEMEAQCNAADPEGAKASMRKVDVLFSELLDSIP